MTSVIDVEIEEEKTVGSHECPEPECKRSFENERGLKIHQGRVHKSSRSPKTGSTKTKKHQEVSIRTVNIDPHQLVIAASDGKHTFTMEPAMLLDILSSAKHAAQEYVESL